MDKKIQTWIEKNINVNLNNKNVLITGANSGIGFELAYECAYLNANIYMLVRNIKKAEVKKAELLNEFPNIKVNIIELDLSNFDSIKECSNIVKTIDVDYFINNAGVYHLEEQYTINNLEITMGTNYIGTFYLNNLLMEYFKTLNHKVICIFTSSITSKICKIDYNDFYSLKSNDLMRRYGRSKVAFNNMYFYYKEYYKDTNIIFSLIHPGATYTPLIVKAYKNVLFQKAACIFMKIFFHKPCKAALSSLYAMNFNESKMIGPKGLLEMSGYPKFVKFKRNKDYMKSVEYGLKIIGDITNK